jgi:hypothetical protein
MALVQYNTISESLQALGMLQNLSMSNGKKLKITFTRSKLTNSMSNHAE